MSFTERSMIDNRNEETHPVLIKIKVLKIPIEIWI